MRKDSPLLAYYYKKLPKYQIKGTVTTDDVWNKIKAAQDANLPVRTGTNNAGQNNKNIAASINNTFNTGNISQATNVRTDEKVKGNIRNLNQQANQQAIEDKKQEDIRVKERLAAKDFNEGKTKTFTLPNDETKTLDQMNWRERQYVAGKSLEGKGRFFENEESLIDDINPLNWITGMAGALGEAPYQAKQSGSNMPYVSAILNPLLMGRMMGSGSINPLGKKLWTNEVSNPEFLNAVTMGIPGMVKGAANKVGQSMESGILSNASKINPFAGTFAGESKLPNFLQLNKLDDANAFYRLTKDPKNLGLGKGAYFNKGVPLTTDLAETFPKGSRAWGHRYSGPKWNPKTGKIDLYDGPDYLFKVTDASKMQPHLNFPEPHLDFYAQSGEIPAGSPSVQQFKKDWLRGYKQVPKEKNGGDISIPQLSTQVPSWAGKYADGGLTKYQVAGTVCPTGFNKNAFGQCVNASGQTPEQAKAALSGINLSGNTSTAFDGSKYSGNLGSTGVNRMNDENTPAGRLHTATLAYLKRFPQMTYQQALDNVQRGQSSIKNQGTMRAMTPDEIEKNRIDTENEKVRKSNKIYQTSLEKSEGMQADAKEHDKEQQDFLDAKAAIDTGTPYTFPNGKTKLWKEMDGREKAYVHGRKHRLDLQIAPEVKAAGPFNLSDEIKLNLENLNPFSTASRWYGQGAEAPWMARETNSITPYIAAIADPALTIAAASIGAPVEGNVVKYGVKNAFNPLKPFKELQKLGQAIAIGNVENHLIEQGIKKTKKWTMKSGIPTLEKDLLTGPEDGQEEIPVSPWRPVEPNEDITTGDAIPLPKNIAVNQQTVDPTRGLKMGGKVIKQIGGRVNKNNWLSKYI